MIYLQIQLRISSLSYQPETSSPHHHHHHRRNLSQKLFIHIQYKTPQQLSIHFRILCAILYQCSLALIAETVARIIIILLPPPPPNSGRKDNPITTRASAKPHKLRPFRGHADALRRCYGERELNLNRELSSVCVCIYIYAGKRLDDGGERFWMYIEISLSI